MPDWDKHPLRFVVCHLNSLSARLSYLVFADTHLCLPVALPLLSELLDSPPMNQTVILHPQNYLQQHSRELGLPEAELQIATGFRLWVDTPQRAVPVFLVLANGRQPFVPPIQGKWIELPDSFSLPGMERLIMRKIHDWLLE